MADFNLLRTAAIELRDVDSKDVVKVAGILRRIKNWWQAFNDPAYKKQVEELRNQSAQIHALLSKLESEIQTLQSSITDTDVSTYESSLNAVRALSAQLSVALKSYRGTTQKAETSAPTQTVEVPTAEDTPAEEGASRFRHYTLKQLKDPAVREQLEKQLPGDYDVPLNTTINKPVTSFQWFWALGPSDFYFSEAFVGYFQRALAEVLALRKIRITGDPTQDLAIYNMIVQTPEVEAQIRTKLPQASIDGTLVRVDFQKPSKEVSHRNANEMLTVIQTAPFDIILPSTQFFEGPKKLSVNAVVLYNDMRSAYVKGQHLSAAGIKNLRIVNHDFNMPVTTVAARVVVLKQLQKRAQQNIHQWARDILHKAFVEEMGREPSINELQAAQSVALIESNYGRGWGKGKNWWARHEQMGLAPDPRASTSNNWGAVQTRTSKPPDCPGEAFRYVDSNPTASGAQVPYAVCFKSYPTPVAGARDLIRNMYKGKAGPNVLSAANAGSVVGFSSAMYDRKYYGGFGKTPADRVGGHAFAVNNVMKNITNAVGEKPAFDIRDDFKKKDWANAAASYRAGATTQQAPTQIAQVPDGGIMQEFQTLLRQLAASRDCGPVESIVRKAMERAVLPNTKILFTLQSEQSLPMRVRFARIFSTALREELGADSSIHHKENLVEIECDVVGPKASAVLAANGLFAGVAKAFATATKGKLVTGQSYIGLESKYPLLESKDSEMYFRKFAFEMMVSNG